jgi:hypothetical protein
MHHVISITQSRKETLSLFQKLEVGEGDSDPEAGVNAKVAFFRLIHLNESSQRANGQHRCLIMENK